MTDQERIKNLETENHALRETAREWKNACEREIAVNARMKKQLDEIRNRNSVSQNWIPVDVILPEWGKEVIVKMKDGSEEEVRFSHDHKWISQGMATCESSEATHWKPKLPATVEAL